MGLTGTGCIICANCAPLYGYMALIENHKCTEPNVCITFVTLGTHIRVRSLIALLFAQLECAIGLQVKGGSERMYLACCPLLGFNVVVSCNKCRAVTLMPPL